ncbi:MAG: TetR/AcrR family transcriptional regulator [Alphaproteobacteria bacterium]|nr:TetR/AcrR family transcriptional regulator [Alphaproteobacteria bacterium]
MRQTGSRNRNHDARRAELIAKLRRALHAAGPNPPSWRELAAAAGVSLSTLTHYFGRRDDVVQAVMADDRAGADAELAAMATPAGDLDASMRVAALHLLGGFRHGGLDALFATGLREGSAHPLLGPAFLDSALEPTLAACEARLAAHRTAGELRDGDLRTAALQFVAPIVLAALHQQQLGGCSVRPLDLDAFAADHAAAFVRAWRA